MQAHPSFVRRCLLLGLGALACGSALAQPQTIKIVVPFPPGGVTDVAARALAERMSRVLGETLIVENRAGAGSRIGIDAVARSAPDGRTLLFTNTSYSILPIVDPTARYEPTRLLAPVTLAGTYSLPVVVSNKLPVTDLQGLIDYARSQPGKLSYGSAGQGSGTHFAGEYFKLLTGTNMVHVPYKSTAAAAADVAAGLLDLTFDAASKAYADAGKVRILAVTGSRRDPRMPAVPTVAEAGLPAFTLDSWLGLLAPQGLPKPMMERLEHAATTALADPGLRRTLEDLGVSAASGEPGQLGRAIGEDVTLYRRIVAQAKIRIE